MFIPANDGRWVDENYARLAEIIKDYDPILELRWIPPDRRTRDDKKPYIIVDTKTNQPVLYAAEIDTPVDILAKLFEGDNKHGDVLSRMDARNAAIETMRAKKNIEEMEEATDYAQFLMQSPLNFVKANGKKYDHDRNVIGTAKGSRHL